ncbi:hypothetical protein ACMA1I_01405 [Pontibacter sp. 13R65]|uniref:hypothetical protein n=1 Tax=Pontibacter sp. 13R65 TaxID=3127458 RepID=UPI00301CFE79
MKPTFYLALLYLCLSLVVISCSENEPEPVACMQAEVVHADCETGWYVLRLLNESSTSQGHSGRFIGQIRGGLVTTDNLPEAYKHNGMRLELALELNAELSPRCMATSVMYPAVRVTHICSGNSDKHLHLQPTVSQANRLLSRIAYLIA